MTTAKNTSDDYDGLRLPFSSLPEKSGLYDPRFEHDACGVSFVVDVKGRRSHDIVATALGALCNLEHRGAQGAEANSGDGAGILMQVPDAFLRAKVNVELPPQGTYGVGLCFLPADLTFAQESVVRVEAIMLDEGLRVVGWREVPVDESIVGATARGVMPSFRQIFVVDPRGTTGIDLDRKLFIARKRCEHEIKDHIAVYFPSLSCRTLVYKGMLTSPQLAEFFPELSDARIESALALVHSRFSTNTFPEWPLAHPYRMIAHNGEINTVKGNFNWMRAREGVMKSPELGDDLKKLFPLIYEGQSDTACFDNALELLVMAGYPVAQAMMMMIPEAWENHTLMDENRRAFYEYHAAVMEPWDGPAAIAFTDGRFIGGTLDRNGLRPARYIVTEDDLVVMASEAGVLPIAEE